MSLKLHQEILARLYTDHVYRDAFFKDRQAAINSMELSRIYIEQLMQLKKEEVDMFANGLINKRSGSVKAFLPGTFKILEVRFNKLFFIYAQKHVPKGGVNKYSNDAIMFANYLLENSDVTGAVSWIKDLIRFELMIIMSSDISKSLLFRKFNYAVSELDPEATIKTILPKRLNFILMIRKTPKSRLRTISVKL
jgi:hypothetical protein